jgi:hypothetical protein
MKTTRFKYLPRYKKHRLTSKIRRTIQHSVSEEHIPDLLKYVFNSKFNYGFYIKTKDYQEKTVILENLSKSLSEIKQHEHQSGTF